MLHWLLLAWLFAVWILWAIAATLQVRLIDVREPLPNGKKRLMSVIPVIPLFPMASWGIACLVDRLFSPGGTIAVASLHLLLAIGFAWGIVQGRLRLKDAKKDRELR